MGADELRPGVVGDPDVDREPFAVLLRRSVTPTLVVTVAAVLVAAVLGGAKGAWSAGLGGAVVIAFFSVSLLVMGRTATWEPMATMGMVLVTYTMKILALAVVMIVFRDAAWLSGQAFALSIIVCTVAWLAVEMRAYTRLRLPIVTAAAADRSASSDQPEAGDR